MRVTPPLSKGFFGRSVDEFKRLSISALTAEGTRRATSPLHLANFHSPESLKRCKVFSDADTGGFSKVHFDWRSGYAAWRTLDQPSTIFGKSLWNIDAYGLLALRIKSDGRKYFVNIQTESIVPTDIHQHRLYARSPGEWETVLIKWNEFVRTNHGVVVEPQGEMLRQKVRTVGIGLIDRVPGDFQLCVERIWATNGLSEADLEEDGRKEEGQLKSKHGEKIRWGEDKFDKTTS
ncbi:complex I intermediate-associated protein 30 [Botrytis cinerea]